MVERRIPDVVDAQDGIERAALALVGEFHAVDVIRDSAGAFGDRNDLILRNVDELRVGIDEAPDQPGTGDAVDLWMFACNPLAWGSPDVAAGWEPLVRPTRGNPLEEPLLA